MADRKSAAERRNRGPEFHESLSPASRDNLISRSADRCSTLHHERTFLVSASPAYSGRQYSLGRCRRGRFSSRRLPPVPLQGPCCKVRRGEILQPRITSWKSNRFPPAIRRRPEQPSFAHGAAQQESSQNAAVLL